MTILAVGFWDLQSKRLSKTSSWLSAGQCQMHSQNRRERIDIEPKYIPLLGNNMWQNLVFFMEPYWVLLSSQLLLSLFLLIRDLAHYTSFEAVLATFFLKKTSSPFHSAVKGEHYTQHSTSPEYHPVIPSSLLENGTTAQTEKTQLKSLWVKKPTNQ